MCIFLLWRSHANNCNLKNPHQVNPSKAEASFIQNTRKHRILKSPKPCHIDIHWIALAEYSQISTNEPEFQLFFRLFASFCIGQISHQQHKSSITSREYMLKRKGPRDVGVLPCQLFPQTPKHPIHYGSLSRTVAGRHLC